MLRRLRAFALMILFLAVIGGGLFLWWKFDLRWRPHLIAKDQAQIGKILDSADWVSPGLSGAKLYMVTYRDCDACNQFQAAEFPALQKAGVDTRVIVVARPDRNGQPRSTAAERSTVAELWMNRNWGLYQRWMAGPSSAWTAPGLPVADNDIARSAVVEVGRDVTDKLTPLLKENGIRFGYPLLIWWTKDGKMEGCACRVSQAWSHAVKDLGAN
jgi:hypothetical protein